MTLPSPEPQISRDGVPPDPTPALTLLPMALGCLSGPMAMAGQLQPTGHIQLPLVFINKILLEHSHNHSFTFCLGLLSCSNSGTDSRLSGMQSLKCLLSGALEEKGINSGSMKSKQKPCGSDHRAGWYLLRWKHLLWIPWGNQLPRGTLRVLLFNKERASFPHCFIFQNQSLEYYKVARCIKGGENWTLQLLAPRASASDVSRSLGQDPQMKLTPSTLPTSSELGTHAPLYLHPGRGVQSTGALTSAFKTVQKIKKQGHMLKIGRVMSWQGKRSSWGWFAAKHRMEEKKPVLTRSGEKLGSCTWT